MTLLRYPWSLPPGGAVLAVMAGLYLVFGLVGHDPWKADDVTHFGVAYGMLEGSGWLVPRLAGEPFLAQPPLYYWLAAASGRLFGWLLPLHDAVRLASAAVGALYFFGMAAAARILFEPHARSAAVLLALGCLGLLVHIHDTQPALSLLAAFAWTAYGLGRVLERPGKGAAYIGWAIGLGFLAAGLPALFILVPLVLLLPLVSSHWRAAGPVAGILLGLAIAAIIASLWPLAVLRSQPAMLGEWWVQSLKDLALDATLLPRLGRYLALLPWFAWPAFPLLLWTLWRQRHALHTPGITIGATGFAVTLVALGTLTDARSATALPLLPPLVLLAVPAVGTLRRGAANGFDWFAMMAFGLFAGVVWLGWIAMLSGWPERLARQAAKIEPGFVLQFSPLAFAIALALTLAWIWLVLAVPQSPYRGTLNWAAGITMFWGLAMTLWLPWIEYGKSYRMVSASLARALPENHGCIAGRNLGEAQRASFHYFDRILTVRQANRAAASCRLLLVQYAGRNPPDSAPGSGWRKIWEDRRRGDRNELFRLYRKD